MSIYWIPGKENRQRYLAEALRKKGKCVRTGEEPRLKEITHILLPIPESRAYMERIRKWLQAGQIVFGCGFTDEEKKYCNQRQVDLVDYMKSPGVAVRNAVATAEGALAEAITMSQTNVQDSQSIVVGYGRCGQILSYKLCALGSRVNVVETLKEKRAWAKAQGMQAYEVLEEITQISCVDFLFNTVPKQLITNDILGKCNKSITIIDIASGAGGVDYCYCKKERYNAKHCLGLPGIYAPKTSADILLEVVLEYKAFP